MTVDVLGTAFAAATMEETVQRAAAVVADGASTQIITANVDQVVRCRREPRLREIFCRAGLVVADGVPVLWAARFLGRPLPGRVNGTDLMERLCEWAGRRGSSVFLLGGPAGAAEGAARAMSAKFPGLRLAGTLAPGLGFESRPGENEAIRARLRQARPDILFVSLGFPKGIGWIDANLAACGVPLAIEVGITFRYLAGQMRRAPSWMQRRGLEWLWRLLHEPRRLWKRYLVRDLPFFYLVLRQKLARRRPGAG